MVSKPTSSQHINIDVTRYLGKIDAIYIKLLDTPVARTEEATPNGEIVVDYDKAGNIVGIEMLEPCRIRLQRMPALRKVLQLQKLDLNALQKSFAYA